jgi:hypothetical protein
MQLTATLRPPSAQAAFPIGTIMASGVEALENLALLLRGFRFRFCSEDELQTGIANALARRDVLFARERVLSAADRPDFLVPCLDGDIAIEVKTKGSFADLLRQVARYAEHERVKGVLVVGSPRWIARVPDSIAGTPVRTVLLANLF